jgi:uncharacterized protein (DUF486 family)
MTVPKKYLRDKLVLLLVTVNVFMTFLCTALILLRVGVGRGVDSYIVGYRPNLGLLSGYQQGNILPILSFIVFVLLTCTLTILISISTYSVRRALSLTVLSLGTLILLLAVIVSNALLTLY